MNGQEYYKYLEEMHSTPNNKEKIIILLDQIIEHEEGVDKKLRLALLARLTQKLMD